MSHNVICYLPPPFDASIALVILRITNVAVSIPQEELMLIRRANLAPIGPECLSFPPLIQVLLKNTEFLQRRWQYGQSNTDVHKGRNLAPIGPPCLSFPALDVSTTQVILRFTSVDFSIARGMLIRYIV